MKNFRLLLAACIAFASLGVCAQSWPTKTVRIISPFPPGGSVDAVARLFAAQLTQQTGQQFIVENRTGASGVIGTQVVASSPPDGHTLAVVFDTHGVNPSLMSNMPYDTLKDLAAVMLIGTAPMALVAHPGQPFKDFRDVLAAAKSQPVPFGSVGSGSLGHLAMTQIANMEHVQFTHVPYKGGGPLMIDAIGGQVPLAIGTVVLVSQHVKAGKVKALAVTSEKRSPQWPDVGTMSEQGVPGFSAVAWWGLIAPGATPPAVVKRINEEFQKALNDPALAGKLREQGMDIVGGGPEVLDKFLRSEIDRWAKVVRDNKIKAGD
ncbi:MAG TPA: tripartite tricarboxylate transporter substrate binding protein [Usitatibacter sp.]|nr:tripartite tricarboxylate transporter substrate binding protein [Usitatibacter sp.]